MKNVYLYIVFLFASFISFGQDFQNANWLFGVNAGVSFFPNLNSPTPITGSAMSAFESCASVSDQMGNLLFYTDGEKVWNKNHTQMPNGFNLLGDFSASQIAIVPKPGSPKIYYIITINGFSSTQRGLHYSEVNMDLNGANGDVSTKNMPFKDHLGVDIVPVYNNQSEKVTTTKHSNGVDYWIIAQIKQYIYAYRVTSSGVEVTPYEKTIAPVNTSDVSITTAPGAGGMKISPQGNRIGICYSNNTIALGSFNSATGSVTFNTSVVTLPDYSSVPPVTYSLEFSPSGENIYFTTFKEVYKMTAAGLNVTRLVYYGNSSVVQLAINGKIYIAERVNKGNNFISVINTPDDFSNPNYQEDAVNIGASEEAGLPQWVHMHQSTSKCLENLVLVSPTSDLQSYGQDNRQASGTIYAYNVINYGANAIYHAGSDIVLKPGFHGVYGTSFRGYIEGCNSSVSGATFALSEESESAKTEIKTEIFTLSPNPATENVTVASNSNMVRINVTSLDGFTVLDSTVKGNSYTLDVSNYKKGIYVVTVTTDTGETEIKKLVKS